MKRYLVTGGAGFIGSHLVDRLIERGDEVTVLDNLVTGSLRNLLQHRDQPRFHWVEGNVCDLGAVEDTVDDAKEVFHLAAAVGVETVMLHPEEVLDTEINGTLNVLKAARAGQKPVTLISTSEVYGKNTQSPNVEEISRVLPSDPRLYRWIYSDSKFIGEMLGMLYLDKYNIPIKIVRPFNITGPRQLGRYGMVLPRFVEAALREEPLTVYEPGVQHRTFTNISDAVDGLLLLSEKGTPGEVYNLGDSREPISMRQLAELVIKKTNSASSIVYREPTFKNFDEVMYRCPDASKLQRLGWAPKISLDQTIQQVVDFLRRGD